MDSLSMLEFFFAAAAIAFYLHYLYFRKQNTPRLSFHELTYDKTSGRLELNVHNTDDKVYYIKPSLRLARLTPADEWKEQTTNGNGFEMMNGKAGNGYSVIKGYDLLGYHESPVPVAPGESKKLVYFLTRDMDIKAFDNIKVDVAYGFDEKVVERRMECNMIVKVDAAESYDLPLDALDKPAQPAIEESPILGEIEVAPEMPLDGGIEKVQAEIPLDSGLPEAELMVPLDGALEEEPIPEKQLRESGFPIEATCFCCGKKQWLRWVFDSQHVCDECKEFLMEKYSITATSKEEFTADQLEIIHLLRREGGLALSAIISRLSKNKSTITRSLKHLQEASQVRRERDGRSYIYYLNE